MKTILTIPDILERYKVGRQSLWRWRKTKNFPAAISPDCARPFWCLKDIEAWEKSNAA